MQRKRDLKIRVCGNDSIPYKMSCLFLSHYCFYHIIAFITVKTFLYTRLLNFAIRNQNIDCKHVRFFVFGSFLVRFSFWLVLVHFFVFGSFLIRFFLFLGLFLVRFWFVFGQGLVRFWFVFGSFLASFCLFLVRFWFVFGSFLVRFLNVFSLRVTQSERKVNDLNKQFFLICKLHRFVGNRFLVQNQFIAYQCCYIILNCFQKKRIKLRFQNCIMLKLSLVKLSNIFHLAK